MRLCRSLPAPALASIPALLLACGGDGGATCPPEDDHTFVIDTLSVPRSADESVTFGLDVDGRENDTNGGVDNALGRSLASLSGTIDIPSALDQAIDDGSIILLANLRAGKLDTAECAEFGLYRGAAPDPAPCADAGDTTCRRHLDGDASFEIAADSPTDTVIAGRIEGGAFQMGPDDPPGRLTIALPALDGSEPVALELIGARIAIESIGEDGLMTGVLAGAVPMAALEDTVLPALHRGIEATVAADCAGTAPECCTPDSAGEGAVGFFDNDGDCAVSYDEFRNSFAVSLLINPDVDLLDENGDFRPNSDGVRDALSLGMGFTATTATFPVP